MSDGEVTRDGPLLLCREDVVALKSYRETGAGRAEDDSLSPAFVVALGGGETTCFNGGVLEAEVGRAKDNSPSPAFVIALGGGETARLNGGFLEAEAGCADNNCPSPVFVVTLGGGETARLNGGALEAEAEDDARQGTRHASPPTFGEHAAQGRRWICRACFVILRAADASSRVLSAIARDPFFLGVARFIPLAEEATVTLAAACYLIAHPATDHELTLAAAHQERPLRWWVRGALRHAADAASRVLFYVATDPLALYVAFFLPGSEELVLALAAAAYVVAHYATRRAADHDEHPLRG